MTPSPELSEDLLTRLESVLAKADPGPWVAMVEGREFPGGGGSFVMIRPGDLRGNDMYVYPRDMAGRNVAASRSRFEQMSAYLDAVALSRTYLPSLINEVRLLQAQLADGAHDRGCYMVGEELFHLLEFALAKVDPAPWAAMVEGRDIPVGRDSFVSCGEYGSHSTELKVSSDEEPTLRIVDGVEQSYIGSAPASTEDLDAIALSRNYVSVLIAEIRRLRQELEGQR